MKINLTRFTNLSLLLSVLFFFSLPVIGKADEEKEPAIDDFTACEKEPQVYLEKIQNCIVFPEIAQRAGIEGRVIVRVLIGKEGELKRYSIQKSDNEILNEAAIQGVKCHGNFIPAIQKGKPILCWISIPIHFKLRNENSEPSKDDFVEFEQEPKVDLNKLAKLTVYPELARKAGIQGRVLVRVLIGSDGNVRKTAIEESDNLILNDAAVEAIKNYGKFSPAIQKGKPINCWVLIPVTFRLKDNIEDKQNED